MPTEEEFIRRVRRSLHRYPELAHHEFRTAAYIERLLRQLGLAPFRPAPTSVAVVLGAGKGAPIIGFRADLDALALSEPSTRPYASRNPGRAHACGHDGHSAALLGLARRFATQPPPLRVLLVWQQAEEAHPSGAPDVLRGLGNLRPTETFAFHLWPDLPIGTVGSRSGPVLASVAGLVVNVTGRRGRAHGTGCEEGATDALEAGVEFYKEVTRCWTGRHPGRDQPAAVTIGQFLGGTAPNQTPLTCTLRGSIRARAQADEQDAVDHIHKIASLVAARTGASIDVAVTHGIRPPVVNDAESVARAAAATLAGGYQWSEHPVHPVGVSDDFGWFLEDAPGAMLFLGCGGPGVPDLHQPDFDFDESVLVTAVDVADLIVRNLASPPASQQERIDK